MGKYLYLVKNIGLLALSNFATKLLSFFLVPLYTNILSTTEYGTYDLFYTTASVLVPVFTLNIQESVLRFALDKKYNRDAIVTIAVRYFLFSCSLILVGLVVNSALHLNQTVSNYAIFFFLMFLSQALSGIVLAYICGIDKIKELSISSVLASAATIGCNLLFLVIFKWGLYGYFLANTIGPLLQCIYLMAKAHFVFRIRLHSPDYSSIKQEMLTYSCPLIANSIAWWVNNASDRYVVVLFCGLAANGVYSVASKIPSILNIVQSIFSQAWTLSAVKDFDPEDKSGFFTNTYRTYNCFLVILCSAIVVADKILAKFLYAKDFYVAWRYVPWLTIAIVFGALSGYIGGFFSAVKNSKIYAQSTIFGAVSNVAMNIIFTPVIGALGAAIATAICYFIVWAIRYWHSKRFIKLRINLYRDLFSYALLVVQSLALLVMSKDLLLYGVEGALFIFIVLLYIQEILQIVNKICKKLKRQE